MESVTYVAIPGWGAAAIGIIFAAFVAWWVHDRVTMGETLISIREHLATLNNRVGTSEDHIEGLERREDG